MVRDIFEYIPHRPLVSLTFDGPVAFKRQVFLNDLRPSKDLVSRSSER